MHWLFLLLGLGAMAFAFRTPSPLLMGAAMLASLSLLVAWMVGLYNARMGGTRRDEGTMVDPDELRRLRELADARRAQAAEAATVAPRGIPEPQVHGRASFPLPDDAPPQ